MENNNIGITRIGKATLPCDITRNHSKTFDTPLVANLGETVFFLNPQFKYVTDEYSRVQLLVPYGNPIINGVVSNITYATGCGVSFKVHSSVKDSIHKFSIASGIQELFFRTSEEVQMAAKLVNQYSDTHSDWGKDWAETYRKLISPVYPYTLHFPICPQQTWRVKKGDSYRYMIPNRVIANIFVHCADIRYQGMDSQKVGDKLVEEFFTNLPEEYKIIPSNP